MVPESDMVELIGHMTRWKSADLFAHLEAVDEILTPLYGDIRDVLGAGTLLPDVAGIRMEYEAKVDAVYQSATAAEAEDRVRELIESSQALRERFQRVAEQMLSVAAELEKEGMDLQQELPAKIDAWVQAENERIGQQIAQEDELEKAALQARMEEEAMSRAEALARAAGANADLQAIKSQVDAEMAPIIAQAGKELQEKMMRRGEELREELDQAVEEKADELSGGVFSKLARIRDSCQKVSERIEELARQRMSSYDVYYQKFLKKKGEIIGKAVDAQLAPAEAVIQSFASELATGRSEGRDLPSAGDLLAGLSEDKQTLVARLMEAESDAEIDEAVNQFRSRWDEVRKALEAARVEGAQEIIDSTRARLAENDVESSLRKALTDITAGIKEIEEARAQGEIGARAEETLMKLRQLLPQVQEGLALIDELNGAEAGDGVEALLELKDRLQGKLDSIRRCCEEASLFPGHGIFIEAENESSADLLPGTEAWYSNKETDAAWRPGASGNSDWYLSRGGESLTYQFDVLEDGAYTLWIRDLATTGKEGQRAVSVTVDGVDYGEFAENPNAAPEPGAFGWHMAATVSLTAGRHTLVITKAATTSGAAILDCFYLTADPDEVLP